MKQKITITLDDRVIEEIKLQAVREKRSVGEITEEMLREYLSRQVKVKLKTKSK